MKILLVTSMKMQKKANTRAPSRVPHVAEKDTNFIQLKFFIKNLKNGGLNTHLNACRKKKF